MWCSFWVFLLLSIQFCKLFKVVFFKFLTPCFFLLVELGWLGVPGCPLGRWYMKYFAGASNNGPVEAFYKSFMPDVQRAHTLEQLIDTKEMPSLGFEILLCHVFFFNFLGGLGFLW